MNKLGKIILLLGIILLPIILYYYTVQPSQEKEKNVLGSPRETSSFGPKIVLIFDDMGESLERLRELYSLGIPLTLAVIPDRRFSKQVAYRGKRLGYSILIHIPLEPEKPVPSFLREKEKFIRVDMEERKIVRMLKWYLNSIRIAIGVNNHMGSKVLSNEKITRIILTEIKKKKLVFVDSHTSSHSVACKVAGELKLRCETSAGFLDSVNDPSEIKRRLYKFIEKAKSKKKGIIIIAHPHKSTLQVLRVEIPKLKDKVKFLTLEEYLNL